MTEEEKEEKLDNDSKFISEMFPEFDIDTIKQYLLS